MVLVCASMQAWMAIRYLGSGLDPSLFAGDPALPLIWEAEKSQDGSEILSTFAEHFLFSFVYWSLCLCGWLGCVRILPEKFLEHSLESAHAMWCNETGVAFLK